MTDPLEVATEGVRRVTNPQTAAGNLIAEDIARSVLDALKDGGYELWRKVTEEEEAANVW